MAKKPPEEVVFRTSVRVLRLRPPSEISIPLAAEADTFSWQPLAEDEKTQGSIVQSIAVASRKENLGGTLGRVVASLAVGAWPEEIPRPPESDSWLAEDGRVREGQTPMWTHLPPEVGKLFQRTSEQLHEAIRRGVNAARWRAGIHLEEEPAAMACALEVSPDGKTWCVVPHGRAWMVVIPSQISVPVSDVQINAIRDAAEDSEPEPVAHELLREAFSLRGRAKRSALVLAVSAAEIGFKQLVARLVPDAAWLVDNVPSPPLVKMLEEYLPTLPLRSAVLKQPQKFPAFLTAELRKAVTLRNETLHKGREPLSPGSLEQILLHVGECLWLFDAYGGHDWALAYIQEPTRKALGLSNST